MSVEKEYYETINQLKDGYVYYKDEYIKLVGIETNPITEFIPRMDQLPNITSNEDLCTYIITEMIRKFPLWETKISPIVGLRNLHWAYILLQTLGVESPIVYPSFEHMEREEYLDLCVKALKEPASELYVNLLDGLLSQIIEYVSDYDHTVVDKGRITGTDDTYYNIETGEIGYNPPKPIPKYASDEEEPFFIDAGLVTMEEVLDLTEHLPGKTDTEDIIRLISCFNTTLKHNAKVANLILNSYKELLGTEKLLKLNSKYELDIRDIQIYLEEVICTIIDMADYTKKRDTKTSELFELDATNYTYVRLIHVDITRLNYEKGLIVKVKNELVTGYVETISGDRVEIFKVINYSLVENEWYDGGPYEETIFNLWSQQDTEMGSMLLDTLNRLSIKGLYLQEPKQLGEKL